jgi:dihydrofolate reductase
MLMQNKLGIPNIGLKTIAVCVEAFLLVLNLDRHNVQIMHVEMSDTDSSKNFYLYEKKLYHHMMVQFLSLIIKKRSLVMIAIIVAMTPNRVIGKNGQIPWKIPGEQKQFKELTTGQTVVFGRKAFDEIGKPLPNRKTILVSSTKKVKTENCTTILNLEDFLKNNTEDIYIAGGAGIYQAALPYTDVIYLTIVNVDADGDVYFPEIHIQEWECAVIETAEMFTRYKLIRRRQ